jgi:hypothetical protein
LTRTAKSFAVQTLQAHGKGRRSARQSSVARQSLCRAIFARRTAKVALPGGSLPCILCRARPHGKGFAERIWAFAVRFGCTAKHCFPVVFLSKRKKKNKCTCSDCANGHAGMQK